MMLLGVAATINVMAVTYTAKAMVTLQAESGYTCNLMLSEAAEYGALNGSVMNMDDRKVALYALNGTQKLQIAKAADLSDVKIGLLTDASTNYTITVSNVEGTETLYLYYGANEAYALTAGASYNFTATANTTDETRFSLKKTAPAPAVKGICFNYNILTLTKYNGAQVDVYAQGATAAAASQAIASDAATDFDLNALASGEYLVKIDLDGDAVADEEYRITVKPAVTAVP